MFTVSGIIGKGAGVKNTLLNQPELE